MPARKPYKTIDDVPKGYWNLIVLCLKRKRGDLAEKLTRTVLMQIQEIPVYQVYQLRTKLLRLSVCPYDPKVNARRATIKGNEAARAEKWARR